jgi:RNA polymerase sigma-70 factor (ECF subfamily)
LKIDWPACHPIVEALVKTRWQNLMRKGGRRISDREIIQLILQGKTHYYRELVVKYQRLVYFSIAKIIDGSRQEAEDLVQEVFLSAYRSLAYLRQDASFSAWLLKIAVNKALDYKRKKQPVLVRDERTLNKVADGDDPLRKLIQTEEKNTVNRLIKQLPSDDQQVIIDYYFNDLSYKEIAHKKQIQVKTVESKLYRARKKLKKLWEEGDPS